MTRQADRHAAILAALETQPRADVETLCALTGASPATVRRDLTHLAEEGALRRIRGGAQSKRGTPGLRGMPFQRNFTRHVAQKRAIAAAAADLIEDGETIIVDAGTTTFFMCPHLAGRNLQVLTNSLPIVDELVGDPTVRLHVPAGQVYREQNIILSPFEDDGTAGYAATKMFMGAHAVTTRGIEQIDSILVQAERRLINRADQVIVVADSTKLDERAGLLVCALSSIATVVTDENVSTESVAMLEDHGVEVVTAVFPVAKQRPSER